MSNVVHKNENYEVIVANSEYEVVNTNTGVVEETQAQLPASISYAEYANSFLVFQQYKYIRQQAEVEAEFMAAQDKEEFVNFDMDPEIDPTVN